MEKNKTNEKSKINNLLLTWIKDITHMSNFWDEFLMESKHKTCGADKIRNILVLVPGDYITGPLF